MYANPELLNKLVHPDKITLCVMYCHTLLKERKDLLINHENVFRTPKGKDYNEIMEKVASKYNI